MSRFVTYETSEGKVKYELPDGVAGDRKLDLILRSIRLDAGIAMPEDIVSGSAWELLFSESAAQTPDPFINN